jgi:hypothetical protein
MAQQTIVTLVDDLDGGKADETVAFSLDGVDYKIDLSEGNAAKLRAELADFVANGRRTGKAKGVHSGRGRSAVSGTSVVADKEKNQAIREWARRQGMDVADRGRISAEIIEKYNAAR